MHQRTLIGRTPLHLAGVLATMALTSSASVGTKDLHFVADAAHRLDPDDPAGTLKNIGASTFKTDVGYSDSKKAGTNPSPHVVSTHERYDGAAIAGTRNKANTGNHHFGRRDLGRRPHPRIHRPANASAALLS